MHLDLQSAPLAATSPSLDSESPRGIGQPMPIPQPRCTECGTTAGLITCECGEAVCTDGGGWMWPRCIDAHNAQHEEVA